MELQIVNKAIALELKELGFDWECNACYFYKDLENNDSTPAKGYSGNNHSNNAMSAPTQALVGKWFRDVHNLNISISTSALFTCELALIKHPTSKSYNDSILYYDKGFDTYESAEEAGIIEAIKILKNGNKTTE